jgi:hypothetical protein
MSAKWEIDGLRVRLGEFVRRRECGFTSLPVRRWTRNHKIFNKRLHFN